MFRTFLVVLYRVLQSDWCLDIPKWGQVRCAQFPRSFLSPCVKGAGHKTCKSASSAVQGLIFCRVGNSCGWHPQTRGVWGHAPSEKFWNLCLRLFLMASYTIYTKILSHPIVCISIILCSSQGAGCQSGGESLVSHASPSYAKRERVWWKNLLPFVPLECTSSHFMWRVPNRNNKCTHLLLVSRASRWLWSAEEMRWLQLSWRIL